MSISKYIDYLKRGVVCFGLLFTFLPYAHGGQEADEEASDKPLTLYFRLDKALVDSGYMDNSRTLRHLNELLTDRQLCARIDSIHILSFTSPDGNRAYNDRLARQRSIAVKGYLVWKYPHLDQYRIHPRPQGENWRELRQLIESDKNLPDREEVLQIIDCTPDYERCKWLLKRLDGGRPYQYLARHILPLLRNASVCVVYFHEPVPGMTLEMMAGIPYESELPPVTPVETTDIASMTSIRMETRQRRLAVAVKTNLLFDAALMPNIEIEVPIGSNNRWSVNGEWMFPWWLFDKDKYCVQVLMGGLEGRYWLGSRKNRQQREVLTGHFLGLYAGGGKYDLQWDDNGYQGEFFIAAGVSYGWATRIARNLHLEFNIGIGLLRTDYRHYHARDNYQTLLWQENGRYTWFGPTKAKISLVWLLNRKVKKGGAR